MDTLAGEDFGCYDVLTKGVGPACLALVVLSRSIRCEPSVAVKPAAAVALASLLLEPLFSAYILRTTATTATATATTRNGAAGVLLLQRALSTVTGGRRKGAAAAAAAAAAAEAAVSRARWLTGGAQVALWAAVVLAYANLSLRLSRAGGGSGRTVAGYMAALRSLAAKKRGTGGWVRIDRWAKGGGGWRGEGEEGGTAPNSPVPGGWGGGWGGGGSSRPRVHSLLGSLYETLVSGGGWRGGGRIGAGAMALSQYQTIDDNGPPFERGEVTVRSIYCFGLDAAITGRPPSASLNNGGAGAGADHGGLTGGADGGGGGIIAGGTSRPFYVTITLGGVTAKTSPRSGFSPSFTEVFPLGCDCPIRGAFLTIAVVDSFETGRSVRGDRIVGEVHLPLDAAQLVPGSSSRGRDPSYVPSSGNDMGDGDGGSGAAYRLSGDWELQGALGGTLGGARVGADIVIHGPPSPSSAAGRLRRRRESEAAAEAAAEAADEVAPQGVAAAAAEGVAAGEEGKADGEAVGADAAAPGQEDKAAAAAAEAGVAAGEEGKAEGEAPGAEGAAPGQEDKAAAAAEAAVEAADEVEESSLPDPQLPPVTPNHRGLANKGITCYLNTSFQLIRGMPSLHRALLGYRNWPEAQKSAEEHKLTRAVSETLWELQDEGKKNNPFFPRPLIDTFYNMFGAFCPRGEQEDVGLVLGLILDKVHEETRRGKTDDSPSLVDSVRGQIETTHFCGCCKRMTTTRQAAWTFQVTTPTNRQLGKEGSWSLEEFIRNVFRKRRKEEACEDCTKNGRTRSKQHWVKEAWTKIPSEMFIFFHRFKTSNGRATFIEDEISIPDTLNKAVLSGGRETGTMKAAAVGLYKSHGGASANRGHWTAEHRLYQQASPSRPTQLRYNDGKVSVKSGGHSMSPTCREWRRSASVFAYATMPPGSSTEATNAAETAPGTGGGEKETGRQGTGAEESTKNGERGEVGKGKRKGEEKGKGNGKGNGKRKGRGRGRGRGKG
eukprot:g11388.t2